MPAGWRKSIPAEALLQLRQRLERLSPKSPERASQIAAVSALYGLSSTSVYLCTGRSMIYENPARFTGRTMGSHGYSLARIWNVTVNWSLHLNFDHQQKGPPSFHPPGD